jgi:flavorubredoxin
MYGNTEKMADCIARRLAEQGIRDIQMHDVSKTHLSFLLRDIWKYRGVILGSCTYNCLAHPMMELLCAKLEHIAPKNKVAAAFGSYSWNGGGTKPLQQTFDALKWTTVADAVNMFGSPTADKLTACNALAKTMAEQLS